jgi:hypothetical protein
VISKKSGSPRIGDEALWAAWQTLFLVVPAISTTFASLPRLFGRLGRESLGCRGHLLTTCLRYSTTFRAIRGERGIWRVTKALDGLRHNLEDDNLLRLTSPPPL